VCRLPSRAQVAALALLVLLLPETGHERGLKGQLVLDMEAGDDSGALALLGARGPEPLVPGSRPGGAEAPGGASVTVLVRKEAEGAGEAVLEVVSSSADPEVAVDPPPAPPAPPAGGAHARCAGVIKAAQSTFMRLNSCRVAVPDSAALVEMATAEFLQARFADDPGRPVRFVAAGASQAGWVSYAVEAARKLHMAGPHGVLLDSSEARLAEVRPSLAAGIVGLEVYVDKKPGVLKVREEPRSKGQKARFKSVKKVSLDSDACAVTPSAAAGKAPRAQPKRFDFGFCEEGTVGLVKVDGALDTEAVLRGGKNLLTANKIEGLIHVTTGKVKDALGLLKALGAHWHAYLVAEPWSEEVARPSLVRVDGQFFDDQIDKKVLKGDKHEKVVLFTTRDLGEHIAGSAAALCDGSCTCVTHILRCGCGDDVCERAGAKPSEMRQDEENPWVAQKMAKLKRSGRSGGFVGGGSYELGAR